MANLDRPVLFLATAQPDRARAFYEQSLGLTFVDDTPFALVFDVAGTQLRIQKLEQLAPAQHTVLGWAVDDVHAAVRDLRAAGVEFLRFDGMAQDDAGVWKSPSGAQVAWFKDPDGNVLSLTESPASP